MKLKLIFVFIFILLFSFYCNKQKYNEKVILSGTSMITSLVKDLDDDRKVINLIPPSTCPGHFDFKPQDAQDVCRADVFIIQPFQKFLYEKIKKINKNIRLEIITTPDLTIPENYFTALKKMEDILIKNFPGSKEILKKNREKKIQTIRKELKKQKKMLDSLRKKQFKVLTSRFQKSFSRWLGFNIIGTFGSPDNLTINQINSLIKKAQKEKVDYIISNLAGNHNITARILNKTLKKPIIVFSNFPECKSGRSYFLNLWEYNINELKKITESYYKDVH